MDRKPNQGIAQKAPRIAYKAVSVDRRRETLLCQLSALESATRSLRERLSAVSNDSAVRARYRTPREFNQYVAKLKHTITVNGVEMEAIRRQIRRCNQIIENRNKETPDVRS